jgi:hypothetical protein
MCRPHNNTFSSQTNISNHDNTHANNTFSTEQYSKLFLSKTYNFLEALKTALNLEEPAPSAGNLGFSWDNTKGQDTAMFSKTRLCRPMASTKSIPTSAYS